MIEIRSNMLFEEKCPDDFKFLTEVRVMDKTKKAAEKRLDDAVDRAAKTLETELQCSEYTCDEGECEFDFAATKEPPKKVILQTKKHGKKRRWIATALVFGGCFCPGADDDPEDDPK
jgi:hypothetical protein